jgi:hypothetical protein
MCDDMLRFVDGLSKCEFDEMMHLWQKRCHWNARITGSGDSQYYTKWREAFEECAAWLERKGGHQDWCMDLYRERP